MNWAQHAIWPSPDLSSPCPQCGARVNENCSRMERGYIVVMFYNHVGRPTRESLESTDG